MTSFTRQSALQAMEDFLKEDPSLGSHAIVLRHGGRSNDKWKVVAVRKHLEPENALFKARCGREAYNYQLSKLRQGAVALWWNHAIVEFYWAPSLRTRW